MKHNLRNILRQLHCKSINLGDTLRFCKVFMMQVSYTSEIIKVIKFKSIINILRPSTYNFI